METVEPPSRTAPPLYQRAFVTSLPWGLLAACFTIVPFLLSKQGVSVDHIAQIMSFITLPTTMGVLIMPLIDAGFSKRTYALVCLLLVSVFVPIGLLTLTPASRGVAEWTLLLACLFCRLFDGAAAAWIAKFTNKKDFGALSGWATAINQLVNTILSALCMAAIVDWAVPRPVVAALVGVLGLSIVIPMLRFPKAARPDFRFSQIVQGILPGVWRAARTPEYLTGFLLFISPIGTAAASNLLDGMGKDFRTPDWILIWGTAGGSAVIGSIGGLLGGRIVGKWRNKLPYLYLISGLALASISVATGIFPRGPASYVASTCLYDLMMGIQFSIYYALTWVLVKESPFATTQLSLFSTAFYISQTGMTLLDGHAYKVGGATSLFLVDGISRLIFLPVVFVAIRRWRSASPSVDEVAGLDQTSNTAPCIAA